MKKITVFFCCLFMVMSGCHKKEEAQVVVTSFVAYDIVKQIVGDTVEITNIVPWGSELHDFEPTPKDIAGIEDADLFIYTSDTIEGWVKSLANTDQAINLSEHQGEHPSNSVHFWVNPSVYIEMIQEVKEELIKKYPQHQALYEKNAQNYGEEIQAIDQDFIEFMEEIEDPTVVFAGHNAVDALEEHYGLQMIALSESYQPSADISAKQMLHLEDAVKDHQLTTLFTEELEEPKLAEEIQKELKKESYRIDIQELSAYHNITEEEFEEGVSYADKFRQNIEALKASFHR